MSISRVLVLTALLTGGCGSIAYDDGSEPAEEVVVTSGGGTSYVVAPAQQAPGPYVTVVPNQQPPPAAPPPAPPPRYQPPSYGPAARHCSGRQRLRIFDEVVDGRGGAGVIASGQCEVEINEAIVRGEPALVVTGNARVVVIESRIQGDIRQTGNGQLHMRGSRHENGRLLRY